MSMNDLWNYLPNLFTIIGVLAITVSVIVEVIKEMPVLKRIPTAWVVVFLSILLSLLSLMAYNSYTERNSHWYEFAGAIVGGFYVAFIATFGWEKFKELTERLKFTRDIVYKHPKDINREV